jgi:hypothetical protein
MDAQKVTTRGKKLNPEVTEISRVGRDEMNLAEFPTAILTSRSNDGLKTLRFRGNPGNLTVTALG